MSVLSSYYATIVESGIEKSFRSWTPELQRQEDETFDKLWASLDVREQAQLAAWLEQQGHFTLG